METSGLKKLGFGKSEFTGKDIVDGSEYRVVDWRVKITDGLFIILTEYHRKRNGKFELVEQALELINKYCHIGLRGLSFKELKELIDVLKKYVLP
jgi:hypothetical protein